MDYVNRIYRNANLFDGYYDGKSVEFNRFRYRWNLFMDYVMKVAFLEHLIIFFTNNEFLKKELVYLKFSDDGLGNQFLNLGGGLALITMNAPLSHFQKFTRDPSDYAWFNFHFCTNEQQMQREFHLSKRRSKGQIDLQIKFLRLVSILNNFYILAFGLFFMKMAYDNIKSMAVFQFTCYLEVVISIKIICYTVFFISFQSSTLRVLIVMIYEPIVSCNYLTNRLNDQIDQISNLFLNKKFSNSKYLNKKVLNVIENYIQIIESQKHMNRHFDQTLQFFACCLLFFILYPALILFEQDKKQLTIYFYLINYFFIFIIFCFVFYFCTQLSNANQKFFISLTYLSKYIKCVKTSFKVLNIHALNKPNQFSFSFRHLYTFTYKFLIFMMIESITFIFLLYRAKDKI